MKFRFIFCFLAITVLDLSCKKNNVTVQNDSEKSSIKQVEKKVYEIPSELKIISQEEIDFDDDGTKDTIITATDDKAINTTEFWLKNNEFLYEFTYPWGSINKKWLVNLDDDAEIEIVRIQGDEDGVDYVIYDIIDKEQKAILYFNPVLEDNRYPNQFMWAYPNDIKGLIVNQKREIKASLNNDYQRDDNHTETESQKELPFIFFNGKTSQPEMKFSRMNKPQFMKVEAVINKVFKNKLDQNIYKEWLGTYSCTFLRMKEESGDPRGWGMMNLVIQDNMAIFKLDSYVENISKDLKLIDIDKDKIVFSMKEDKSKMFIITNNGQLFNIKSSFIDEMVGESQTYKLEKNKNR
ncbi:MULTISPECIES: hypothetical protein [Flavobacterium]|uniref:Uncharacterized protein n=1 Tax=Flavobacterium columnare TaxID=996 RepID=A0AA94JNN9_9FLAO|nr:MULTISPECIES: hypothetical protein [Flavobacterium]MCH4829338.1 hypothetical protein [Flavobacterium columnare]MCH4834114.1 hypothetical protein [Flavobacterium columnare]QYS91610.1 hypothetical protein JJC04_02185 [Flavobacterium covae]